jgi:ABC-type Na+ efflux pump permease subunit
LGTDTEQEAVVEQETPFAATGTEEQGYDVVDRNNNTVNPEKIPDAEQAVQLAESMNTSRADLDFVEKLMGTTDAMMTTKALGIFQKSMEQYNKRKKTSFTTLEEYYKTPDGKRLIEANKESLLTGKPVNYKQKPVAVAVNPVTTQLTLFDSPSTGNVASLTLSSLESLHAKVKEFREQALQDPTKISNFVETGNVPSAPVTEASILNKLQDITRCFS